MVDDSIAQQVLHDVFDIQTHKETFINYLEVIITADGTIEYAVPSHTNKLAEVYGKSMDDVFEEYITQPRTQISWICDPVEWLCKKTGSIAVWNDRCVGIPNDKQKQTLKTLKLHGLYHGKI